MLSITALAVAIAVGSGGASATGAPAGADPRPLTSGTFVVAADGSGDFETISAAVEAVADGDTVLVRPGTYDEAVVITSDITLAGGGPREDIVLTVEEGPILRLVDSDAVVTGLTFKGSDSGGVVVEGGAPRLERLLFHGVGVPWGPGHRCDTPCDSLSIRDGSTATVRANTLAAGGGIWVDGASPLLDGNELMGGPALMLWNVGDGVVVRGNAISGALGNAISVYLGKARPSIEDNVLLDAGASGISVGLGPVSQVDPVVRGNTISGAINGITVMAGAEPLIEDNLLIGNGTAIVISNADPTIARNEMRDNGGGVFVMWGEPRLEGNVISGGRVGLGVGTPGARPILAGNRIVANSADVELMFGAAMPATDGNEIGPVALAPTTR